MQTFSKTRLEQTDCLTQYFFVASISSSSLKRALKSTDGCSSEYLPPFFSSHHLMVLVKSTTAFLQQSGEAFRLQPLKQVPVGPICLPAVFFLVDNTFLRPQSPSRCSNHVSILVDSRNLFVATPLGGRLGGETALATVAISNFELATFIPGTTTARREIQESEASVQTLCW